MGNLNLEIIAQLILVTLVLLAGPAVVFLLSIRKGNL